MHDELTEDYRDMIYADSAARIAKKGSDAGRGRIVL
jgi:hypothetical protein